MPQSAVILEPVTYGQKRRSLAHALVEAGLSDDEQQDDAETAGVAPDLVEMEAGTGGVFEAIDLREPVRSAKTRTVSRRKSSWMPAGYRPEPMPPLQDPAKAAELPWLKAKKKGRMFRKLKVFTAWMATLFVIAAILAGTATVMGLNPWLKRATDAVALQ